MPTFQELSQTYSQASFKKAALIHLIEYIDETLRPVAGADPKNFVKTDDGRVIPPEAFEAVITEVLLVAVTQQDGVLNDLMQSNLQPVQPEAASTEEQSNVDGTASSGPDNGSAVPLPISGFILSEPVSGPPVLSNGEPSGDIASSGPGSRRSGRRSTNG